MSVTLKDPFCLSSDPTPHIFYIKKTSAPAVPQYVLFPSWQVTIFMCFAPSCGLSEPRRIFPMLHSETQWGLGFFHPPGAIMNKVSELRDMII